MPYENEFANKASHADIVGNPDVKAFLNKCNYLREPDPAESEYFGGLFEIPPEEVEITPPEHIFAMDGSVYESVIDDRMPSTKVGYVKVSTIHILMEEFGALRVEDGKFVDPFRVAKIQQNKDSLLFVLPGANMTWKGHDTVRESFRARLDEMLLQKETRFNKDDHKTSLRSTLFHLASMRPGKMSSSSPDKIKVYKCPSCEYAGEDEEGIELDDIEEQQYCPSCKQEIYPSDTLRLWEEVSDYQSNIAAMTRFMLAVEHILPAHYIRHLIKANLPLDQIASIVFFIDGPLAIFRTCAWLSRPLMRYYYNVNKMLLKNGRPEITIIGLQKSGQLADYFSLIDNYIPDNRLFAVNDEFRYKYVVASRDPSHTGFGEETYYGQDFFYKTPSGRRFIVGLPYPFESKASVDVENFHRVKTEVGRYKNCSRALKVINTFETDLYKNAVIPIALAHRYTAISASPGGRVLDILSKSSFSKDRR